MNAKPRSQHYLPRLLLLCVAALNAGSALAFQYQWNLRDMVASDGDTIELRTRGRALIGRVDTAQMRVLYAVKASIERAAEVATEVIIVDGDAPNAFATMSQQGVPLIGITLGMLELLGNDVHAMAALIGHEMAHLKLRHGDQRAARAGASAMTRILGGVALNSLGVPLGGAISDLTVSAFETQYSRDQEREADYLGAIWAVEAGYDADGAVRLQQRILKVPGRRASTSFLSSHPSGQERVATLRALSRRLDARTVPADPVADTP